MHHCWQYQGKDFTEFDQKTLYGFVYIITNTESGRKYLGKKLFFFKKTRQVKGKKKRYLAESDWKTYYGSNAIVQAEIEEHGTSAYHREILYLCTTKSECSYMETREIINQGALLTEDFYNAWVSCKVTARHLNKVKERIIKECTNPPICGIIKP